MGYAKKERKKQLKEMLYYKLVEFRIWGGFSESSFVLSIKNIVTNYPSRVKGRIMDNSAPSTTDGKALKLPSYMG